MYSKKMKHIIIFTILAISLVYNFNYVNAQTYNRKVLCIVKKGDCLWKISRKHHIKLNNIIDSNSQFEDPNLIYPGDKVYLPTTNDTSQTTPQPSETNMNIKEMEQEVVRLVNLERRKRGLQPYTHNQKLSQVARTKSEDMKDKNYFSHTSPTYGSPFEMMKRFGIKFTAAGENIAKGQRTPQKVMQTWMNSPGHRKNILSNSFTQIGVGLARDSRGVTYWTQMFIRP